MRDIPGFEGLYAITKNGKVWSYPKPKRSYGIWIKPYKAKNGYIDIDLMKNKKRIKSSIHRLLALTYIKNPKNKNTVNHKDGNKENNKISNLEWCTQSENSKHSYKYLNRKRVRPMLGRLGKDHNKSKQFYIKDLEGNIYYYGSSKEFKRKTGLAGESINFARQQGYSKYTFIKGKTKGYTVYFYKPRMKSSENHEWKL